MHMISRSKVVPVCRAIFLSFSRIPTDACSSTIIILVRSSTRSLPAGLSYATANGFRFHSGISLSDFHENARKAVVARPLPKDVDENAIFANNEIDLSEIEVYGFDYDYTLACYSDSLQNKMFEMGKQALVKEKKYPKAILNETFSRKFAIRGLHFDLNTGFLMKLDAFHHIQKDTVYRGLTAVDSSEVLDAYCGFHVPVTKMNQFHGGGTDMHQFVDIFALPEVTLLSQVIEYFQKNRIPYDPAYVFWDVRNAVQSIHNSGDLHLAITSNLDEYLTNGKEVGSLLERLKSKNKKLFLISNSGYPFINKGMCHMIGSGWRDLFDLIIISARKPDFFISHKRPFRIYNPDSGTNMWYKVQNLLKGTIYTEGNLFDMRRFTGWNGFKVLYFGDHVYTDLADATLHHGWRTGAIIPELQGEIAILNQPQYKQDVMWLMALQEIIETYQDTAPAPTLDLWRSELRSLRAATKNLFNPQFGSLFRTYHNPTYFSRRLARFADLYTSKLTNLLHYSTEHTFYPRRGALAHEMIFPA